MTNPEAFVIGEPMCLLTLLPLRGCPHCAALPKLLGRIRVTAVDVSKGVITVSGTDE